MNKITIDEICHVLDENEISFRFNGRRDLLVQCPASIDRLDDGCVAFVRSGNLINYQDLLSPNCLVVVSIEEKYQHLEEVNLLITSNPEIAFYKITELFKPQVQSTIHPMSYISEQSKIGNNVDIKPFAYIGPNVSIGDGSVIHQGCIIDHAIIGEGTVLQAGVKVGGESLGGIKGISGRWYDRPHFGIVKIGSNVRIEDNVVINRGYLKNTVISNNVRIGTTTWIGNSAFVTAGVIIAQSVTVAGSVSIGKDAAIWGNASLRDGVTIGDEAIIGMGAVVVTDVPSGELWIGNPAKLKKKLCINHTGDAL